MTSAQTSREVAAVVMKSHLPRMKSRFMVIVQFIVLTYLLCIAPGCLCAEARRKNEEQNFHKEVQAPVVDVVGNTKRSDGSASARAEVSRIGKCCTCECSF